MRLKPFKSFSKVLSKSSSVKGGPGVIHACRWGELQQDAVAAQCDDERLLPHTAALGLPGNGTLEHTRLLSW